MQKKEEEIKMAVTKREDRKFKFETLQLHVGQEQPDPATEARAASGATAAPMLAQPRAII